MVSRLGTHLCLKKCWWLLTKFPAEALVVAKGPMGLCLVFEEEREPGEVNAACQCEKHNEEWTQVEQRIRQNKLPNMDVDKAQPTHRLFTQVTAWEICGPMRFDQSWFEWQKRSCVGRIWNVSLYGIIPCRKLDYFGRNASIQDSPLPPQSSELGPDHVQNPLNSQRHLPIPLTPFVTSC